MQTLGEHENFHTEGPLREVGIEPQTSCCGAKVQTTEPPCWQLSSTVFNVCFIDCLAGSAMNSVAFCARAIM